MAAPLLSESGSKFRVAICGGGIGGLVLAITIGKYDPSMPIDLYEAHDSIDTAGVGISIWKQVHEVMIELGLFDDFKQIFTDNVEGSFGINIRRSDIPQGGYHWYCRPYRQGTPSSMHRQHMVAILEKHLPGSCAVHLRRRLVSYVEQEHQDAQTSPIRLEFADGTIATTDVLVGADGIRSAVRKTLFRTAASEDDRDDEADLRQYVDAIWTGILTYRFLVPAETLKRENPECPSLTKITIFCGKGRYLIAYPISKGALINVAASVSDPRWIGTPYEGRVTDVTRDEVVDSFADFEPDGRALVKLCEKPSKFALHVVKPLPFCVRKRVALIGDACHAMTPNLGAGAGQAIDDAFILGRLLSHPLTTHACIPDALRMYQEIRLPLAQTVASYSLLTGRMSLFVEPGYYDGTRNGEDLDERGIGVREREGMEDTKKVLLQYWEEMDESKSALETWKDAERKIQASM